MSGPSINLEVDAAAGAVKVVKKEQAAQDRTAPKPAADAAKPKPAPDAPKPSAPPKAAAPASAKAEKAPADDNKPTPEERKRKDEEEEAQIKSLVSPAAAPEREWRAVTTYDATNGQVSWEQAQTYCDSGDL